MPSLKKIAFIYLLPVFVFAGSISAYYYRISYLNSPQYLQFNCMIINREGKLIYRAPSGGTFCDFFSNGWILRGNWGTKDLRLYDENDNVLWNENLALHHDLKISRDEKSFLVITAELFQLKGVVFKADCFSRRDLSNKIEAQWCVKDHLDELKSKGVLSDRLIEDLSKFTLRDNRYDLEHPELSHTNSIYEIPEVLGMAVPPGFSKGNYIVNLHVPTNTVVIFDHAMKQILWVKSFNNFKYAGRIFPLPLHDVQVTPNGLILAYANSIQYPPVLSAYFDRILSANLGIIYGYKYGRQPNYSSLIEWDPQSDSIVWQYTATPNEKFRSLFLGSVTKLPSGNYLFSDVTSGGVAYEITPDGRIIWPKDNLFEKLIVPGTLFQFIKPLRSEQFLKSRNLL